MSCPTCGETMQLLYCNGPMSKWWYQRCGTNMTTQEKSSFKAVHAPKLVDRCQRFEQSKEHICTQEDFDTFWRVTGIREAIYPPDQRATTLAPVAPTDTAAPEATQPPGG